VSVLRSAEDVEALGDTWLASGGDDVEADRDYFLWSLRGEPHVVRPHVLVLERPLTPATVVAGRLVDVRLPCKLGSRTLFAPRVRALSVSRHDSRGALDAATADAVLDELQAALDRDEADVVLFRHVDNGSPLHRALLSRASVLERRQHTARANRRWVIDLPSTGEDYLASLSSSTQKGAHRTAKRLEREFGARMSVTTSDGSTGLEALLDEIESVAARTYQRQLGVGYLGTERQRARLALLARHGWLRTFVLSIDGRPVAFELGELYAGRFQSLAGGYDSEFARYGVGGFLLLRAIGELADDPDVTLFDFGFGDAPYKSKLAHRAVDQGDVLLYARRLRPQAVSASRTALLELLRLLTRSLARVGVVDALRRRARRAAPAAERHDAHGALYGTASACSPGSSSTT
jgi:hypothetical protein